MTGLNATSILITGASSGIGAALSVACATPGRTLFLGGRDRERLASVADTCRAAGAATEMAVVDVTDAAATHRWIEAADDRAPLDLVIANAGVSGGTAGTGDEPPEQVAAIFATNFGGVHHTVAPSLARMRGRPGGGQIALMSSLAGFRGFAGAPAYCASKAAVRVYGEGLRGAQAASGVRISVICPGFVRTPMTGSNTFRMPFLMDADRAAAIILRGLATNRARIAFPWPMYGAMLLMQALPVAVADRLSQALPAKG